MLKVFRPIQTNRPGQKFGENLACISSTGKISSALSNGVCPAGTKLLYPQLGMKGHSGEDWGLYRGEPVYHSAEFTGKMKTEVDRDGGVGVDVVSLEVQELLGGIKSHVKARYWHLLTPVGWDGKEIHSGDLIGYGDNTGMSSGDHLHWALKKCDKDGKNTEGWNGYMGAFDQAPYFENKFVVDVYDDLRAQVLTLQQQMDKLIYTFKKWYQGRDKKNG